MHRPLIFALVLTASAGFAQTAPAAKPAAPPVTLRSTLLAQLRSTHNTKEWFTPINTAVAGLTPEQAGWVPTNAAGKLDPDANHSVGMLGYHLLFWNQRCLGILRGEKNAPAPEDNEKTFNTFSAAEWKHIVEGLDANMTAIEEWTAKASDAELAGQAGLLQHIAAHNAYHTGQILYVRKLQGSFDGANGVR